jgi:flagellin
MNAYRNLSQTDKSMSNSLEKLSSGLRINKAADDAAGLSISQSLQSQIGGLQVAARNAQDGVNVTQTADGALGESESILQRMRDLSVQSSNGGSQDLDAQAAADTEFQQLSSELDRISSSTKFGSQSLLGGSYTGDFQVDSTSATTNASSRISLDLSSAAITTIGTNSGTSITGLDSAGLGLTGLDLKSTANATAAMDKVDAAIKGISTTRATLGAFQNRFEHTINNINVAVENLSASKSAITDTDMAKEMTSFTKSQILQQAGTAMLAQANQAPQSVMKLLG